MYDLISWIRLQNAKSLHCNALLGACMYYYDYMILEHNLV